MALSAGPEISGAPCPAGLTEPVEEYAREIADVGFPFAQRRDGDLNDVQPEIQVARNVPCATASLRSSLVAAMMRTSTFCVVLEPTGSMAFSWMQRRIFAWSASGMSPISSRNSVPPSACAKRPLRLLVAPV